MKYEFLDSSIERDNIILPNSDKIDPFLLKNNQTDIIKAIDFINSEGKFLYIHGFIGTGKRQFINYLCEFLSNDVIKLEYYCKEATVCDDIILTFTDLIDKQSISKAINLNAKITTLNVKFQQQISSIKKPFLIILHSFDDVLEENQELIKESISSIAKEENVKIIVSTRAMLTSVLGDLKEDKKVFLKAFNQENFKEYLLSNQINAAQGTIDDFYKYTRGYYYYTALTVKIVKAMNIELSEFLQKFAQAEMSFDSYLSTTYVNIVPTTIRNFFWFLRTIRHGISLNALAVLEIYDEFSIEYLKSNLMIFQADENLFVQDYFLQKIDISIPQKTQIKLHKYIIGIYESQLRAHLKDRIIMISRQAMRAEIEYHNNCIKELNETNSEKLKEEQKETEEIGEIVSNKEVQKVNEPISKQIEQALALYTEKKFTESIECFKNILEIEEIDLSSLVEVRLNLARLYKEIVDYQAAIHYYELVETYYKQHKEFINLNYLYYDMTDIYNKLYKNERAIETIKKVIYSVDTPQSLLVSACTLLGNIYSDINSPDEAYSYYQKAIESLNENIKDDVKAELYFKFALVNDDKEDSKLAYEYYNKCIAISGNNPYKVLAYSNLGSCYFDNGNYDDAFSCLEKAYKIDKCNNNFDGIYYNASYLAKVLINQKSIKALDYILEAKKSAEFLNEDFYILESSIALGDYYYNDKDNYKKALKEYYNAYNIAVRISREVDIIKIESRISDMKLRMKSEDFTEIESKYAKQD